MAVNNIWEPVLLISGLILASFCVYFCFRKIEQVCMEKKLQRLALIQQEHSSSYFDPVTDAFHRNVPESDIEHCKMIHRAFRNHTMKVQEADFYDNISNNEGTGCGNCIDVEIGVKTRVGSRESECVECYLVPAAQSSDDANNMDLSIGGTISLPVNEMALPVKSGGRRVSNTCTICLCEYGVNDKLVWSSNILCKHAFHAKCIGTWFVRKKTPFCPICRRCFFDGAELEQAGFSCSEAYKLPLSMHEFREI
uniref:RING-type domain-containing protein n=1 Tax=Leptocylindrus danicus TaxID=163516 RepID=A0A7S2K8F7_9STRA|mmetsp:Transcript_19792/g.29423  ORF Transcript_19792/g.29423 Transcript_19792/m.29423 type:complete len:252 (+) Transcript_19792:222-977(+)|eukprot:CAMPEP_0116021130 /NCGR_PEP_ID=MMETSP0321-20121206/10204_1 /TAXON_ID=163516 /ORGANISM="Leptocylindrus danicus var. danicus, Strain B650" /LENGTH=251 /DNA_ID=CAMNT_0003491943 /DNA_START=142 /DNA_END=897 /DNA_ORIENTATION=+